MDTRLGSNADNKRDTRINARMQNLNLLPIGVAPDARIVQAQRRFEGFSVLKHDGFIGDAAVASSFY